MSKNPDHKWTEEEINYLIKWKPHFTTQMICNDLKLNKAVVLYKVRLLNITKIPKKQRLCYDCRVKFQRHDVTRCHECYKKYITPHSRVIAANHRKNMGLEGRIRYALRKRLTRSQAKILNNYDIDTKYMLELWHQQKGRCFYTGIFMSPPFFDSGDRFSASIERLDSNKGYIKGNVVWASVFVNRAKSNAGIPEFVFMCKMVSERFKGYEFEIDNDILNKKLQELQESEL